MASCWHIFFVKTSKILSRANRTLNNFSVVKARSVNYSRTSINGHLSTTDIFFGGQSIHSLLFQPLYYGHLSTMATLFCPQGGHCREVQLHFLSFSLQNHSSASLLYTPSLKEQGGTLHYPVQESGNKEGSSPYNSSLQAYMETAFSYFPCLKWLNRPKEYSNI